MASGASRFPLPRRRILGVVLLVVGAGLAAWVFTRPVPVVAYVVTNQAVVAEVMGTGTLEARTSTTVGSKVSGRIAKIEADQGDNVERGQVLVRLDDADARRLVDVARADKAAAEASVARAQADRVKAEAILAGARREHERLLDLVSKSVVSQIDVDKAQDTLRIAEAGVGASRGAVLEVERRRTASERSLEYHQARLAETVIRAPFDGLITRRHREPGDVTVPGTPILSLIATGELWVRAWVDETEMARLAIGQKARVVFRSKPSQDYVGAVARLGREVDRETREFIVDVRVSDLPKNWAVGQRAEVFIEVDRAENTLAVPARLVGRSGDASGVFVHQEGRARWSIISLGLRGRGVVEVSGGLQAGAKVLERSDGRPLRDGGRVILP